MYTHGKAHHVDGFDNVRRPVATLLVRLDLVDYHVMLLLAVGRNIERRKKYLSAVLHASEEDDDVVLLLDNTLLLLDTVSNALDFEDVVPKRVGNLDVVLYGSRVSELRFLSNADELFDIEPFAFEKSCIVWYWIIRIVGRRNTADNSELLDFLPSVLKVGEWRLWIKKFNALDVLRTDCIPPVGIENVRYHALLVGRSKADIARLFADDADDATGILIEDEHADAKSEVLEILAHAEEVTCEVVVQHKVIHLRLHLCGGKLCVIDKSAAIADFSIEHLASAHCLVGLDEINDVVRHLIVTSPRDLLHLVVDDDWCDVMLFLEDF